MGRYKLNYLISVKYGGILFLKSSMTEAFCKMSERPKFSQTLENRATPTAAHEIVAIHPG